VSQLNQPLHEKWKFHIRMVYNYLFKFEKIQVVDYNALLIYKTYLTK